MSHFAYRQLQLLSLESLLQTLEDFNLQPQLYTLELGKAVRISYASLEAKARQQHCSIQDLLAPVNLEGYRGDKRDEVAHIVVARQRITALGGGASNDLGFHYQDSEYHMIISEFDERNGNGPLGPTFADRLFGSYSQRVVLQQAAAIGFEAIETQTVDGIIRMRLVKSAHASLQTSRTTARR
jgi:hypothetical protein